MRRLLLALCLLTNAGFSQTQRIDSLKREMRQLNKQPVSSTKDTLRCQTLKALMRIYSDINIDSSMYYNRLLIGSCSSPELQKELIYAYQYAGYLYQIRGEYDRTIQYYYKALLLAQKLKQPIAEGKSYGGLAHACTSLKQYAKATKLCLQGLAVLRRHPDVDAQLSILNVLGALYREQGKLANALKINLEMHKLAQRERRPWFTSHGLHAVGWVYLEMGNAVKALDHFRKALTLCRQIGSNDLEQSILLHIADVYIQQKKWRQALTFCNLAEQMAARAKNSGIVAEAYEKQYRIFRQRGELAEALTAYENFNHLKDSLSKEKIQQRIELLQAQYENERNKNALQKERISRLNTIYQNQQLAQTRNGLFVGIVVVLLVLALLFGNNQRLQAKNREIDRQRDLLEAARQDLADINKTLETRVEERTKELIDANQELLRKNDEIRTALFKGQTIERKRVALELHDNLSSLLSAVNMSIQSINPQNLSEPEQLVYINVKQLIQNAYTEVRNISHNILPAELEREGLALTLTTLVNRLNQNLALQLSLIVTGLQERLPLEIEFNVYSIVLELINNAIKHASATAISISLLRTDIDINISVTDDGIGLELNRNKRGVGLQNIQTRLDSLGGTITTLLPTEKGTRIIINIPIEAIRINGNIYTN